MEKSGEFPPVNESALTRTQSSVPSNLTKQRNQQEQQRTDALDSSISRFQSKSNNHRLSQHPKDESRPQGFQNRQKPGDVQGV
jgi:hypothetical protein